MKNQSKAEIIGQYLAEIGRKGGSATSERKAASSRENGKLGGRPKGSKSKRTGKSGGDK